MGAMSIRMLYEVAATRGAGDGLERRRLHSPQALSLPLSPCVLFNIRAHCSLSSIAVHVCLDSFRVCVSVCVCLEPIPSALAAILARGEPDSAAATHV